MICTLLNGTDGTQNQVSVFDSMSFHPSWSQMRWLSPYLLGWVVSLSLRSRGATVCAEWSHRILANAPSCRTEPPSTQERAELLVNKAEVKKSV